MLEPDEQLALDILNALDTRNDPALHLFLDPVGRDERCCLEQRCQMAEALLGWLGRWMDNPLHAHLRIEGDPLWQAVSRVHAYLVLSRNHLRKSLQEMDIAAEHQWQMLCEPSTRGIGV
jgi:hypothetical protein